jgi:hypothetical protein
MNILKTRRVALLVILCAAILVTAGAYRQQGFSTWRVSAAGDEAQDVTNLERRISLLEQRFYQIESSLSRLEQQSMLSQRAPIAQPDAREAEMNLLRGEIESMQLRLREIECGLVKLDERTTPAARQSRPTAGTKSTDPCRLNPDAPLQLSTRP